ncbi:hypothetical protein COO60DRAFT_687772 [Scenedesmus sp. NREL 46B-D3]|nr:hypothetical protein COO60DRAFT_687772 [Scenedesmus sp. NREL 46B-D3]
MESAAAGQHILVKGYVPCLYPSTKARTHAGQSTASRFASARADKPSQQKKNRPQQCYDLRLGILARSGLKYGDGTFGRLIDVNGQPIVRVLNPGEYGERLHPEAFTGRGMWSKDASLADLYSNAPDIPTIAEIGGSIFMINHFEYPQPASMYISKLAANSDGDLSVVNTAHVPDNSSLVQGLWFLCSGEKTPWGTHLGAEEYPPDCRTYEDLLLPCQQDANLCGYLSTSSGSGVQEFARYFGFYGGAEKANEAAMAFGSNTANLQLFKEKFSCYNYGASPEAGIKSADGSTTVTKWRTLGRISHETAVVMPDNRTVYTSDDGSSGVLLKFVADRPGQLSSGTLYAAYFKKRGSTDAFTIKWVQLGRGNQAELQALAIDPATRFSSMFEVATVTDAGKCPEGFSPANTPFSNLKQTVKDNSIYVECLKIKPGMETAAAFLESRRVAAIKGATTEWEKLEGVTYDPHRRRLYMALSSVDRGMLEGNAYDGLGPDHLSFKPNPCGIIMSLKLDPKFSATQAEVLLAGSNSTNVNKDNACDVNAIAGPDNVFYTNHNLLIAEDTSKHQNNFLWAYNLRTGSLTRILSTPTGGEVTGPRLSLAAGRAYLTWAIQHPLDDQQPNDAEQEMAQRGYVGYLGPLPARALNPKAPLDFSAYGLDVPTGDAVEQVLGSSKVCLG